jgi:hypothetical protein
MTAIIGQARRSMTSVTGLASTLMTSGTGEREGKSGILGKEAYLWEGEREEP